MSAIASREPLYDTASMVNFGPVAAVKHLLVPRRWECFLLAVFACPAPTHTGATEGGNVHWAYAAFFGTGIYELADSSTVTVFRPTARWELREPEIDAQGRHHFGWRSRVPVAIGVHTFEFDDLDGVLDSDNVASISVVPGVEFDYPVTERWLLRSSLHFGWGSLGDGSESAWSYWTTLGSRYSWETGPVRWSLLNSVGYVGYTPDNDRIEGMYPLMTGFEWEYPLHRWLLGNEPLRLNWHATYTYFQNDLDVVVQKQTIASVADKWQVGVAIGKLGKQTRIGRFNFDRFGVAVERGGDDLTGVKFYFRSVFDF